jgi:hypothetical protein
VCVWLAAWGSSHVGVHVGRLGVRALGRGSERRVDGVEVFWHATCCRCGGWIGRRRGRRVALRHGALAVLGGKALALVSIVFAYSQVSH